MVVVVHLLTLGETEVGALKMHVKDNMLRFYSKRTAINLIAGWWGMENALSKKGLSAFGLPPVTTV